MSVWAALSGAGYVLATDVSSAAVRSAVLNIYLHGAEGVAEARVSDLFSDLPQRRFDAIFWNPPYLLPDRLREPSDIATSYFDTGYAKIREYLEGVLRWLEPSGRAFMGFGSDGDLDLLHLVAWESGVQVVRVAEKDIGYEHNGSRLEVRYWLLEILPRT